MPVQDLPDYTREMIVKYTGGFVGLEEQAVRLGSIVPWDLKGNVVLMEDFEQALTEWSDTYCSAGSTIARSAEHKYSGGYSLKLDNAGAISDYASAYRELHYPGAHKYGLFGRLCWDVGMQEVSFLATFWTGSRVIYVEVVYNILDEELKVGITGGYHTVASGLELFSIVGFNWHPLMVLFDLENLVYNKLYLDDVEYDLTDVALTNSVSTVNPQAAIEVATTARAAAAFAVYADDITLTKNVP